MLGRYNLSGTYVATFPCNSQNYWLSEESETDFRNEFASKGDELVLRLESIGETPAGGPERSFTSTPLEMCLRFGKHQEYRKFHVQSSEPQTFDGLLEELQWVAPQCNCVIQSGSKLEVLYYDDRVQKDLKLHKDNAVGIIQAVTKKKLEALKITVTI